ncbi:hypothetical protein [Providencia huaxiensis]|uniref:hypothetical protein n=1 Tax=Providencia huaxiensis TaxID=2027290 RepID=UPI000C7EE3F4|nr:hypothetical protein [Providencia huaxiensis]AXH60527.1 hypothetical protein CYG50_00050 [Providencia huaxiensis]
MKFMVFIIMLLVGYIVFFPANEKDLTNQMYLDNIQKCDAKSKEKVTKFLGNEIFLLKCANDSTIEVNSDVYKTIPVEDVTAKKGFGDYILYYGVPFGIVFFALSCFYYVLRRFF